MQGSFSIHLNIIEDIITKKKKYTNIAFYYIFKDKSSC